MDTQDVKRPDHSKIFERFVEFSTGIYAKIVSIRGDITVADPLPVKIQDTAITATVQVDTDELEARFGATTDAAVVTDAAGSVSAKLRGLVKMFADVYVSASHWLFVQNAAGENHIGEIGGNGNIVFGEIIRPADTAQYAANDVIGTNVAVVGVTAQAITGLCLVEVAASVIDTVLIDQDYVTLAAVGGTTEAIGSFVMTKVDATHFSIPIAFVHNWTSGGTIAKMLQFDVARVNGGSGYISWLRLNTNNVTLTNATFDIYCYWGSFAAILDNAQQTVLYANANKGLYLGTIVLFGGGTGTDSARGDILNLNVLFKCAVDSKRLYFRIVNTSATGYIPASAQKFKLTAGVDLN